VKSRICLILELRRVVGHVVPDFPLAGSKQLTKKKKRHILEVLCSYGGSVVVRNGHSIIHLHIPSLDTLITVPTSLSKNKFYHPPIGS
jgi:hypothetical protein